MTPRISGIKVYVYVDNYFYVNIHVDVYANVEVGLCWTPQPHKRRSRYRSRTWQDRKKIHSNHRETKVDIEAGHRRSPDSISL